MQPRHEQNGSFGPAEAGTKSGASMAAIGKLGWIRICLGGGIIAVALWSVISGLLDGPSTVTADAVAALVGAAASAAAAKVSLLS